MKRNRVATGVCAGLFTVAALAAPAAAAPEQGGSPDDCPIGAVCFWTEPGFNGEMTIRDNPGTNCDPAPNGTIGSIVNHLRRPVPLFADEGCDEFMQVAPPFEPIDYVEEAHSWR